MMGSVLEKKSGKVSIYKGIDRYFLIDPKVLERAKVDAQTVSGIRITGKRKYGV